MVISCRQQCLANWNSYSEFLLHRLPARPKSLTQNSLQCRTRQIQQTWMYNYKSTSSAPSWARAVAHLAWSGGENHLRCRRHLDVWRSSLCAVQRNLIDSTVVWSSLPPDRSSLPPDPTFAFGPSGGGHFAVRYQLLERLAFLVSLSEV